MLARVATIVLGALAVAASAPGGVSEAAGLPAAACVRLVREARIAETAGDVDRAVELLSEAVDRFPEEVVALQELLRIHLSHGLSAERAAELRAALGARLSDPDRRLSPGSIAYLVRHAGDDTELLESLLAAVRARLERAPRDLELLKARASLEGTLGLERQARQTLGILLELEPSYDHVSRAIWLDLALEEWASALELVEPWIDDPEFGAALHRIYLELLAKNGQSDRVMAGVERLEAARGDDILSDGAHRSHLKRLAWNLLDAGEAEFAERLFRRVLADAPKDLEAARVVANLFGTESERRLLTERIDAAVDALEEPQGRLDEAIQYLATGDHQRAFDLLSRLGGEFDAKEEFWFNYGVAAIALERWETAAEAFGRASSLNPGRAESHFQRAKALRELGGRCAAAIVAMKAGLALEPERSSTYYHLAQCYSELGQQGEAALAMQEYRRRRSE